eukprot:g69006.t1
MISRVIAQEVPNTPARPANSGKESNGLSTPTMPQVTIKYRILQNGTVIEEVEGVKGDACRKLTQKIEENLGVVESVLPTSDHYAPNTNTQQQHVYDQWGSL